MSINELIKTGIINRQHAALLSYIRKNGSTTNRQLSKELGYDINVITPRNYELRSKQLLQKDGKTYDRETNRTVTLFTAVN